MESTRQGNLLVVRFSDGDDLISQATWLLEKQGIRSGIVLGGVGMLKPVTFGFYKGGGDYQRIEIERECELCALSGNIAVFGNDLMLHLHGVVGLEDGRAVAGHILGARVHLTCEVALLATEEVMMRKFDPQTGLKKLEFK